MASKFFAIAATIADNAPDDGSLDAIGSLALSRFYSFSWPQVAFMPHNNVVEKFTGATALENYASSQTGNLAILSELAQLTVDDLFPHGYQDAQMAACCLAGIWLLHNFLHEGHEICQNIDTPAGNYWHAIMHRAEGDYSNSKYWFRMAQSTTRDLQQAISDAAGEPYSPEPLVDRMANAGVTPVHHLVIAEWQVLFDYCYDHATTDKQPPL